MDSTEPALKPQWLKSSQNNGTCNSPNSNLISSRNRLISNPSDRDRLSKSKAYSSFGSRNNRNRNRSKKQEKDNFELFEKDFDSFEKDKLRRSRSFTSAPIDKFPEKNKTGSQNNGFLSKKDFPLLKTNGVLETGKRVESPMERTRIAQNRGEIWNSVLAEVPFVVAPNGSNGSNGLLGHKGSVTGLNMAKAVAQAPVQDRTTSQLTIDPQKIEELTIKQCKQLIPVTPSVSKNLVASSTEKLMAKGLRSLAPITVSKPVSQLGTFQVLNRDKNGTISPSYSTNGTLNPKAPNPNPNPNPNPVVTTNSNNNSNGKNGKNGLSKQAKARLDFFNFLRTKAASAGQDSNPENVSGNGNRERGIDKLGIGGNEKWGPESDEVEMDMCLDPEEEAFLRSLGWDADAEVDALTKEEIDAFNLMYKERMQFSMVAQQKILSMS